MVMQDNNQEFIDGLRFYRLTASQRRSVWVPVGLWCVGAVVAALYDSESLSKLLVACSIGYGSACLGLRVTALSWTHDQLRYWMSRK